MSDKNNNISKVNNVEHPKHYSGSCSLECIDVMRIIFGSRAVNYFCLLNAFKYLWRHKNKNGEEDLKKARWYLDYINCKCNYDGTFAEKYTEIVNLYNKITQK